MILNSGVRGSVPTLSDAAVGMSIELVLSAEEAVISMADISLEDW